MKNFRKLIVFLLVSLLLVTLCACGSKKDKVEEKPVETEKVAEAEKEKEEVKTNEDLNEELVFVARDINSTLDPTKPQSDGYLRRVGALEALFHIESNGDVVPWLAEGIRNIDEHNWEIDLRKNATFWSGTPVTADKVIGALERARSLNVKSEAALKGIEFTAIEDYILGVKTEQKNLNLPLNLAEVSIVNPELDYTSVEQIDLTGMYEVIEFLPKQRLTLVRNENYWGEKAKIKKVIFEEILDDNTRLMSALSGQADIVSAVPISGAKQIEESEDMELLISNGSGTLSVYINLQHPPYDDVRVRKALNWGTDRKELVDVHTEGYGLAVTTWLGSNPIYGEKTKDIIYDKYDLEKAKALLDEAGWLEGDGGIRYKDGKPLTFRLFTWGSEKVLGELIQSQWSKLGVDVELNYVDYSVVEQARETDEWEGLVETWTHYGYMYSILSNHFAPGGSINYGKYDNPEVNDLLEKLKNATEKAEIDEIVYRVNEIIAEDAILVPMLPRPTVIAIKDNLEGFEIHFTQHENFINNRLEFVEK